MSHRIAVVRHGRTAWNAAGRIQGSTDIPLDDEGRAQAVEAAVELASLGTWSHVVSSPLLRARETATIIARELGLPLRAPLASLVERDCGEAEGLSADEANTRWPDLAYPGAETFEQLGHRVAEAIAAIATDPADAADADADADGAIVVSHGQALRRGIETLTGEAVPRIANAETIVLELLAQRVGSGSWRRGADLERATGDVPG